MDLGQDRYSAPMFVEPCYDNHSYANNIVTNQQWTGKTYGKFLSKLSFFCRKVDFIKIYGQKIVFYKIYISNQK